MRPAPQQRLLGSESQPASTLHLAPVRCQPSLRRQTSAHAPDPRGSPESALRRRQESPMPAALVGRVASSWFPLGSLRFSIRLSGWEDAGRATGATGVTWVTSQRPLRPSQWDLASGPGKPHWSPGGRMTRQERGGGSNSSSLAAPGMLSACSSVFYWSMEKSSGVRGIGAELLPYGSDDSDAHGRVCR